MDEKGFLGLKVRATGSVIAVGNKVPRGMEPNPIEANLLFFLPVHSGGSSDIQGKHDKAS